jgi:hypothetical protein
MTPREFFWLVFALVGMFIGAILHVSSAHAQDGYSRNGEWNWDWSLGTGDPHKRWHRTYRRHYEPHYNFDDDHYRGGVHYYRDDGRRDEIVVEERERRHESERRCLDHPEEVVSTEHTGGDGGKASALISAHKLWSARVQWYYGSMWMDADNAVAAKFVCDQASAMDTIAGRLIDNAEKVLGNADQSADQRCVFSAVPCVAPLEPVEDHHDQR